MISNAIRAAGGWLSVNNPAIWTPLNYAGGAGGLAHTGDWVTPDTAMGLPEWLACVRNIADDFGKLPTHLYSSDSAGNRSRHREHPLYYLLHDRPNPHMSAMNFKQLIINWAYNWEAFRAEIEIGGNGAPIALWPIHPSRIQRKAQGAEVWYEINSSDLGQPAIKRAARQIFDFHLFGPDGHRGYNLTTQGKHLVGLGAALMQFAARFFNVGFSPDVALVVEDQLDYAAQQNLRQHWINQHAGAARSHGVAVVAGKMKLERLDIDPEKAQLLQSRQFTARQFCMLTRFPVSMLGLFDNNYSNSESQREGYFPETIHPLTVLFDQEAKAKLLTEDERAELLIETDLNAVLRGSPKTRAEVQRTRIYSGTLTPNEARRMENDNTIGPEGDVLFIPTNLAPLKQVAEGETMSGGSKGRNPASGDDPNPEQIGDSPDTDQARATVDPEIFRPLFFDAAARCVERQAKAIENHAGATPEKWASWSADFFGGLPDFWSEALRPAATALNTARALPTSLTFETILRDLAGSFSADAEAAFTSKTLPALAARWRAELAPAVTEAVITGMQEEYGPCQ